MDFYTRYQTWYKAMNGLVDTFIPFAIKADWDHILSHQNEVKDWFKIIENYRSIFWDEFEWFVLHTDEVKINSFFTTIDEGFDSWLRQCERVFKFYSNEAFKDWYYALVFKEFKVDRETAYEIYSQMSRVNTAVNSFMNHFEQIKSRYTELPPCKRKLFYELINREIVNSDVGLPVHQFTFIDWYIGDIDELLIRIYLKSGKDIEPLIWPERWVSFNQHLKEYCNSWVAITRDGAFSEPLTDFLVDRIIHHDGNLSVLFQHQTEFYPPQELKQIVDEMAVVHTQIVSDNWYHQKNSIDTAIRNSVDPRKLIADTIHIINSYFEGKVAGLIYPLSMPFRVSQQALIDAYQHLLRGQREVDYIRPPEKTENFTIDGDLKNYTPRHITGSPFVEADLLVKAREYLIQQLTSSGIAKSNQDISKNAFQCKLTDKQINTFFERLLYLEYIDVNVTLVEFSTMLLDAGSLPRRIRWLKSNRALAYLLNSMYEHKMINSKYWQGHVEKRGLFLNYKNKPVKAHDLAQAIYDYNQKGNPTESENIDKILTAVKTLRD